MQPAEQPIIVKANPHDADRRKLEAMSSLQLRAALAESVALTVENIRRVATILVIMRSRGEAVSMQYDRHLLAVGDDRLSPEAIVKYGGRPSLLAKLSEVPMAAQELLIEGGSVQVLSPNGEPIDVPLEELSPIEQSIVFSETGVRSIEEQRKLQLRKQLGRRGTNPPDSAPRRRARVYVDARSRTVKISNSMAPLEDFLAAMAEAAGRQGDIARGDFSGPSVGARLTVEERERLVAACKAARLDESEFVRRAILAWLI